MSDFTEIFQRLLAANHIHDTDSDTGRYAPKPTHYDGTDFRSSLEACWAQTLNRLGIVWEYEPETITLPSGAVYIPDFRLPAIGAWLEVKGENIPRIEKAQEFGRSLACGCRPVTSCTCRWRGGEIVIVGHQPRVQSRPGDYRRSWWANWSAAYGSNPWYVRCPSCQTPGWTTSPRCRACRQQLTSHLISAAEMQIEMAGR